MLRLWVTLMLVLTLVGCSQESPSGGPGAKSNTTRNDGTPENRADTFRVTVPSTAIHVTQGKREEVSIGLDRGRDFAQNVKLKFDVPKGLKVVPSDAMIKSGETKTNVFVEAADDATVGRHPITVTGIPDQGKSAAISMDVDVRKKD